MPGPPDQPYESFQDSFGHVVLRLEQAIVVSRCCAPSAQYLEYDYCKQQREVNRTRVMLKEK